MSRLNNFGYIDARKTLDPVRRRIRSRGIPAALQGREIFYTEDPFEASELIGKALAPNTLTVGDLGSAGFAASLHGARLRDVSLLYLDLTVSTTVEILACGDYFAVHMPTNGRTTVIRGSETIEANPIRAAVTSPGAALTMRFDHDSPHVIVRVERAALERHLARILGRSITHPVTFDLCMDLASDAAGRWHGAVQLLYTEIYYANSLAQRGLGLGPLEEFLISSLLLIQPSNYHAHLVRPVELPGRRAVRRAVDYIEMHLSEPITMAALANHVDVSIRSIQQGFREELSTTPMAYIRDRRLERAREDLVDGLPSDGFSVTKVALRWGFNHLGNFSVLYRRRFGESPSETLRR